MSAEVYEPRGLTPSSVDRVPAAAVFAAALAGAACTVHGMGVEGYPLPVAGWTARVDGGDRVLLAHCDGPTLDVGCGPGRMSEHLAERGTTVLGIDVVPEAVERTCARGAPALLRDVFDRVPGEGRWSSVLLADGNIGIGGDPVRLLQRVEALLAPGGGAVVDLAPPGTGTRSLRVALECDGLRSHPFRWAVLGPESVRMVAAEAGLYVDGLDHLDGRWFAVLEKQE